MEELTHQESLHTRLGDEFIWGLKHRPNHINQLILPDRIKNHLKNIINSKQIPNMLFSGSAGVGKTSTAIVLAEMLDLEYLYLNISEQTGIDTLRINIRQFITNVSWDDHGKIVILDECDRASLQFQDALKSTLEQFSKSCSFVFISNHKNKIIDPLQSRLQMLDFKFSKNETTQLKKEFFKSCLNIVKQEKVNYVDKVIAKTVNNMFPDMRKILNELQKLSQQNLLDDIESLNNNTDIKTYFNILKERKFNEMLKYVAQLSSDPQIFYSQLYESTLKYIEPDSLPDFIMLLGKYSFEADSSIDPRINISSFSVEVMSNCKVKDSL